LFFWAFRNESVIVCFYERRIAFSFNGEFMRALITSALCRRWLLVAALSVTAGTPCFAQSSSQNGTPPNGGSASTSGAGASANSSGVTGGAANEAAILQSSEAFVRKLFAWGPDFALKLGPLSQSATPDFYRVPLQVTYKGQTEGGEVFVSKDGKTLFRGDMFEIGTDPFAATRTKLRLEGDPTKGPADSHVTIVEFSDYQCPHCRQLYTVMQVIEQKYPQVRVVYKDFPLAGIHPWATTAAVGARCAFAQSPEGFWNVHDMIFENQDLISSENVYQKVIDFAVRAGLDKEAFKVCLALPDAKAAIQADVDEGKAVQISSTPTVFVNGRPVIGGDENTLEQYIQFELGAQETKKPATSAAPRASSAPKKK
jgi:protein-disulfide isomerase